MARADVTPVCSETVDEDGTPVTRIERLADREADGDRVHKKVATMREYCDLVL